MACPHCRERAHRERHQLEAGLYLMGHRRRLGSHSWPSVPVRIWAFPQVEALDSFSPGPLQEEGSITTHECVIDGCH